MEQHSPLMKLPPELRNRIYRSSLISDDAIDVTSFKTPMEPALLVTCKQIRTETLSIFYHENAFIATAGYLSGPEEDTPCQWLCMLHPARCALISDMRLKFEAPSLRKEWTTTLTELERKAFLQILSDTMAGDLGVQLKNLTSHTVALVRLMGVPLTAIKFQATDETKSKNDACSIVFKEAADEILCELAAIESQLSEEDAGDAQAKENISSGQD